MKNSRLYKVIALFFAALVSLVSCGISGQPKQQFSAYSMDYFDTVISIVGYENSKEEFDKVADEVFDLLGEYHRFYTIYHRFDGMENLCTINEISDGNHRTVSADKRIVEMLSFAKEMYQLTDGMVNVAMGSVLSLWHDYRTIGMDDPKNASLPPVEMLLEASLHVDIGNMIVDEENLTVFLADPEMKLDVGAIAKGYAAEMTARHMKEKGITGYVLNVGGNVCTIGTKPDGTPWTVGLENPDGEEYLEYLSLAGKSVVTSGSYQRFYYVDGKPYHHIIHPDTLMPAEGYKSVSVICENSGLGDALSTALFCMPIDKGIELVESLNDVEAMWLSEDGVKTVSSGWNNFVKS